MPDEPHHPYRPDRPGHPGWAAPTAESAYTAVILAGGRARRLSGVDKPALRVRGRALLEHVLDAVPDAAEHVVVGAERALSRQVRWEREEPPGSGPVAGLAAGLAGVRTATVAVLAADLAGLRPDTVPRLRGVLATRANEPLDGALLVDERGVRQWLIGVWHSAALRRVIPDDPSGAALRTVLGGLRVAELPARPGEAADVDTGDDAARLGAAGPGPV